jgi:hypothetical protein
MGMMAMLALAFTSCKKQEVQTTFKASVADFIVEEGENRAYIDGANKIHFEVGDRLMIFNISVDSGEMSHCATYKCIDDGNHVEFVNSGMGTVGWALDGGYYAYYPSTLVSDGDDGFGGFTSDRVRTHLEDGDNMSEFFVAPEQTYRTDASGNPIISRKDFYLAGHNTQAEANNLGKADFTMKSVCGIWKLQPFDNRQTPRSVRKIEIESPHHLSGWVNVIVPEIDDVEMKDLFNRYAANPTAVAGELAAYLVRIGYSVTEGGNKITLNMPETGVQLGKTRATTATFPIILRPLALTYGATITFTFTDGTQAIKNLAPNVVTIKPNYVLSNGMDITSL